MPNLAWFPQKAIAHHFITDADEIKRARSIFAPETVYHIMYGGRGGMKTYTATDAAVVQATLRTTRVLVTRELQNSISESIKEEIEQRIEARGLTDYFHITNNKIESKFNGSEFIFKGLAKNIKSIKSISSVDVVLAEESEDISKKSWDIFLPSIRPANKANYPHPIIMVLFNPYEELDDTYQRFLVNTPKNSIVTCVNWSENKYFPTHLNEQRLHARETLPADEYNWIWEGKPRSTGKNSIIQLAWIKAARFASRRDDWPRTTSPRYVAYDPAGQGRDYNAVAIREGNAITHLEEWQRSDDLREATERAFSHSVTWDYQATEFIYDICGGYGDGVEVFAKDAKTKLVTSWTEYAASAGVDHTNHARKCRNAADELRLVGFNAGAAVYGQDWVMPGTGKTFGDMYSNNKARAWGDFAQMLYNTYRFVVLKESVEPEKMISLDIESDAIFNKLCRELSTPMWVRSLTNSKRKVEDKKAVEKRTGQPSPNLADVAVMTTHAHPGGAVFVFGNVAT